MGNNSSRTETINWDKIKTENVETPVHSYLGSNANNLITKLNLPKDINNMDTETEIDLLDLKVKSNNLINLDLNSSTSPFISSEKYLSLTKKLENNLNQLGGALDDESSTSYTEDDKLKEKNNNKLKSLKLSDRLSYVSSSAHTGNHKSDDKSDDKSEDNSEDKSDDNSEDKSDDNSEDNSEDNSDDNSEDNSDDNSDDDKSDQTTPNNIKKKHNKSDKSDEDMLDDDEEEDDEELMGGSETVYSTTIDNEVNTSDINLV